jgi:hypothetical protein
MQMPSVLDHVRGPPSKKGAMSDQRGPCSRTFWKSSCPPHRRAQVRAVALLALARDAAGKAVGDELGEARVLVVEILPRPALCQIVHCRFQKSIEA